jgi:tRNA1(Val) A37 N6-methylase TrmN6
MPTESLDALTAEFSVFQRIGGHRFSSDDLVTAWVAKQVCPNPARVADLGCGLGSVLLHLAWSTPQATLVGVEAQEISFELLRRNVEYNGVGDRVTIHHGDLRVAELRARLGGPFDLVTGTPPYFPIDTAVDAMDTQRAYARIEYRGGIEAYTAAAADLLAPQGWFVVCGDADAEPRAAAAALDNNLTITARHVVIPRAGRTPLFTVWTMRHLASHCGPADERQLTLRDADGERTPDAMMLRAFSGFPERT